MKIKLLIFYLAIVLALSAIVFLYNHPHAPITLRDAKVCQAYVLQTKSDVMLKWMGDHDTNPPIPLPNFDAPQFGVKLDTYWIVSGPITCERSIRQQVENLLDDPFIYGRPAKVKVIFSADHAYRLISSTGTIVVLIQVGSGWFKVRKYDLRGRIVDDSGLVASGDQWLKPLNQTFPNDGGIIRAMNRR